MCKENDRRTVRRQCSTLHRQGDGRHPGEGDSMALPSIGRSSRSTTLIDSLSHHDPAEQGCDAGESKSWSDMAVHELCYMTVDFSFQATLNSVP